MSGVHDQHLRVRAVMRMRRSGGNAGGGGAVAVAVARGDQRDGVKLFRGTRCWPRLRRHSRVLDEFTDQSVSRSAGMYGVRLSNRV